ncbi:MAG: DegV family protein [Actinomycetota bacterium]|nr:DegV family protein [Actinomycetota bacterium]
MGRVTVVTDSSTCLPEALAVEFSIRVLPISSYLSEEGAAADLGGDSPLALSEEAELEELTAANRPFVTEYLAAVEHPGCDAAVVVTPAIEFAAMYRNAALAASLANRPAVAIDARTAAAGQALVVLAGAQVAAAGGDLEAVVAAIEDATRRVELVASLASLDEIRRSGPVPEEVLGAAGSSAARSVFRMSHGTVEPLGATGGAEESLETIRDAYRASTTRGVERTTVFHAGAHQLAARLEQMLGGVDFVSGFSAAMQVHTGRGVVGAAWLPRAPDR